MKYIPNKGENQDRFDQKIDESNKNIFYKENLNGKYDKNQRR